MAETKTLTKYNVELYWKDGKVDRLVGWGTSREEATADAANNLGYGGGALAALDYWDAKVAE